MTIRSRGGEERTTIRAAGPGIRPPTQPPPRLLPGTRGPLPVGLPVADGTGRQFVADEPLWISRWQNSTSPPDERPWVRGYRWWVPNVKYPTWGPRPADDYRIDFLWKDHRHAYYLIP